MKSSMFGHRVTRFEFTAKIRWFSFVSVFLFMMAFFLAMPTSQLAASINRVNWDNRCLLAQCL